MDCSICYDPITKETGKAELSCSHTFHLKCLSKWFLKNENCPCCRHQANETEKMSGPTEALEDSDDDSDDDEDEDEDGSMDSLSLAASIERARQFMAKQKANMTKGAFEAYAATRIAALVRGYQTRVFFFEHKCLQADVEYNKDQIRGAIKDIAEYQDEIDDKKKRQMFYRKVAGLSRPKINVFAVTMIQSMWRAKKQQALYKAKKIEMDLCKGLVVEMRRHKNGSWKRIVSCGSRDFKMSNYFPQIMVDFDGLHISDSE